MSVGWFASWRRTSAAVVLAWGVGLGLGCDSSTADGWHEQEPPDARLKTHAVVAGEATIQGHAYLTALAEAHRRADGAPTVLARVAVLREALAEPVPAGLAEAEVLRIEVATRLGTELAALPDGVPAAMEVLLPMLPPDRSLPLHRASARALVTLGDLAVRSGDDALAAGSYARAIRLMSLLRRELEP